MLRWIGVIALILLGLWFAAHIPRTVAIFLIAAFVAFGVQPIVVHLEKQRVPRPLAIALVFLVLMLAIAVGILVIVPIAIVQSQLLITNAPGYLQATQAWLAHSENAFRAHFASSNLPASVINMPQLAGNNVAAYIARVVASLGTFVLSIATALFIAISATILSVFFLLQDKQIADGFAGLFPPGRRETARNLASEITAVFGGYISGQVIVSTITGVIVGVASAVIGFKFALILGVITAIAYSIPILGMLVAQIFAALICAPQGIWMVVWVQVIMFGMARISDNILVPKIMGNSVGVSPIGVMFAVFAGGELFGLPGLILGIPAAALIKLLWKYFVVPAIHGRIVTADASTPLPEHESNIPQIEIARQ